MSFAPTGIANLYAWYVADTIGTTNNNNVYYWADSTPNSTNFVAPPASSNAPLYVKNAVNGHAAVLFSSGQYMTCFSSAYQFGSQNTTFIVFNTLDQNMRQCPFSIASSPSPAETYIGLNNDLPGEFFAQGASSLVESTGNIYQVAHWQIREDNTDADATSNTVISRNGVPVGSGYVNYQKSFNQILSIGRVQYPSTTTTYYSGYISEIIGYSRSLNASEESQVTQYLQQKYFTPDSVSGLFIWFDANQIGAASGSPVNYWGDFSGSGNNLTPPASSNAPTFYPNVINGFPIVRFSGGDYLSTNATNSLNATNTNLSLFCVYSSTGITPYPLVTAYHTSGPTVIDYFFGTNTNSGSYFIRHFVSGQGLPVGATGAQPISQNQFSLTSTRFRQSDGELLMGYYDTLVGSGDSSLALTAPTVQDTLLVGYDQGAVGTTYFQGDIAEIIGYQFPIAESDAKNVNQYLINKYFPGYSGAVTIPPNLVGASAIFNPTSKLTVKANRKTKSSLNFNPVATETTSAIRKIKRTESYGIAATVSGQFVKVHTQPHISPNFNIETILKANAVKPAPPYRAVYPNDIAGLFAWYKASSIGLTQDGSPVQYWRDDSGSGNHLALPPASSSWVLPTFHPSIWNGYPTVRFPNGAYYSYLQSTGNVSVSNDNLSTFCVFSTIDDITEQSIYSIDDGATNAAFDIALNHSFSNSFIFSEGNLFNYHVVIAQNPNAGSNVYSKNQMVIRSDRFSAANTLNIGVYGAELPSQNISILNNVNNPKFKVGYSAVVNTSFYGDIAEILCYNRQLSTYETELVNSYLLDKYMPGNVGGSPLFIVGNANPSLYDNLPLYMYANYSGVQHSTTLYTGSSQLVQSGTTLYQISTDFQSNNTPLFTLAGIQQSPLLSIFLANYLGTTGTLPFYTAANKFIQNNQVVTLSMSGSAGIQTANTTLYTVSAPISSGSVPLYMDGNAFASSGISLYMIAGIYNSPELPFFLLNRAAAPPNHITLYVSVVTPSVTNTTSPLYTFASAPGVNAYYDNISLYIEAAKLNTSLPLYVQQGSLPAPDPYPPSGAMPLFIGDPTATGSWSNSLPLYLGNYATYINSITKRLYIAGAGELVHGGYAESDDLTLFIANNGVAPPPASSIPGQSNSYFYNQYSYQGYMSINYFDMLSNYGSVNQTLAQNAGVSLYMAGGPTATQTGNFSLYTNGTIHSSGTGVSTLYMYGGNPNLQDNIVMYTRGF